MYAYSCFELSFNISGIIAVIIIEPLTIVNPRGNLVYEANYRAGLRILDVSNVKEDPDSVKEVGYFDVAPDSDGPGFSIGSWSNYPYFASGSIIVSSIDRGLFVLKYTGNSGN